MNKMSAVMLVVSGWIFMIHANESSVTCSVVDDGIEKIKCTLQTARQNVDRQTTFQWHSQRHPQDDRERMVILPSGHGSVYDYRFLRGRAEGIWEVRVSVLRVDGTENIVEHHFLLENGTVINRAR